MLCQEYKLISRHISGPADTIYFGGGTPSLLSPEQVYKILQCLPKNNTCEVTLEANPATITKGTALGFLQAGINRVSLGIQSLCDNELVLLNRLHNAQQAKQAVQILHSCGFDNISLDLIYALPNQTLKTVLKNAQKLVEISPKHISTYCLSLDDDAPLAPMRNQQPDDDTQAQMYYKLVELLQKHGYQRYEVSNFCQSGYQSKHNLAYWTNKTYIGLGAGASGYKKGSYRWVNPALPVYQQQLQQGKLPARVQRLTRADYITEYVIMRLRTALGLDESEFYQEFGIDFTQAYAKVLAKHINLGFLQHKNGRVSFTSKAWFVSDAILADFV